VSRTRLAACAAAAPASRSGNQPQRRIRTGERSDLLDHLWPDGRPANREGLDRPTPQEQGLPPERHRGGGVGDHLARISAGLVSQTSTARRQHAVLPACLAGAPPMIGRERSEGLLRNPNPPQNPAPHPPRRQRRRPTRNPEPDVPLVRQCELARDVRGDEGAREKVKPAWTPRAVRRRASWKRGGVSSGGIRPAPSKALRPSGSRKRHRREADLTVERARRVCVAHDQDPTAILCQFGVLLAGVVVPGR
jgi:hypothetical protein